MRSYLDIEIIFRVYPAAAQVERIPGSSGQRFGSRLGMAPSSCFFWLREVSRFRSWDDQIVNSEIFSNYIYIYVIIYHSGVGSIRSHKLWLISIINVVHQKNPLGLRLFRIDWHRRSRSKNQSSFRWRFFTETVERRWIELFWCDVRWFCCGFCWNSMTQILAILDIFWYDMSILVRY